jgi:hypothetical protein
MVMFWAFHKDMVRSSVHYASVIVGQNKDVVTDNNTYIGAFTIYDDGEVRIKKHFASWQEKKYREFD